MSSAEDMKVILVISAWGTGSTSVAGFLDKCGGYTCPPHVPTVDEKTPNAYEPEALRTVLRMCIDEKTLKPLGNAEAFVHFFPKWIAEQKQKALEKGCSTVVLKHPLLTFLLPAIIRMTQCKIVMVTRPLDAIEATRERRNWHPTFGSAGAAIIYRVANDYLSELSLSYLSIAYQDFRANPEIHQTLLAFCGMNPTPEQLGVATAWLR